MVNHIRFDIFDEGFEFLFYRTWSAQEIRQKRTWFKGRLDSMSMNPAVFNFFWYVLSFKFIRIYTVEDVKSRTGFTPVIPEKVPETEPPNVEEMAFIREFDRDRILPRITV